MSKSQKGSVLVILVFFFVAVLGVAGFIVYKSVTNSTKKLTQEAETLKVALKTDYQNPFDKKTQYENPFNDTHNPFDDLK